MRPEILPSIEGLSARIMTDGELNYAITVLCDRYIKTHGKRYDTLNAVMGVLSCAAHEFYRRVVVPYEEKKAESNGEVYTCQNS
jgi:hypothetical protein